MEKIKVFAAEHLEKIPSVLNVDSGTEYTVNDCYETVAKILGYTGKFVHDLSKPSGTNRRLLDVTLMNSIGLFAETSLEQSLTETVDFYINRVLQE